MHQSLIGRFQLVKLIWSEIVKFVISTSENDKSATLKFSPLIFVHKKVSRNKEIYNCLGL